MRDGGFGRPDEASHQLGVFRAGGAFHAGGDVDQGSAGQPDGLADILQLHGNETPERVATIKARTGLPVLKAIAVSEAADVARAGAYTDVADQILFDAKAGPDAILPGGNGISFDWRILASAEPPFALSGGLDARNVAQAIRLTGASLVDVSSGVETAPGEKDATLITQFVQAARSPAPEHAKAS